MSRYKTQEPPQNPQFLPEYLSRELPRIEIALDQISSTMNPNTWNAPTLVSGWSDFGTPYAGARYRLDATGNVHLDGLVKGGASGSQIFTLPVGFRPLNSIFFPAAIFGGYGQINIAATGVVNAWVSSSTWTSLAGIYFLAEQ